jgi:transcriptional regulator with XRE-family HTH domain
MTTLMVVDGQGRDETRSQVIARRIRGELAQIGLSMSKAAERVGMSQQKFSRRMTGNVKFDVEELDDLCRRLGISFEYITSGIRALPGGPGGETGQPSDLPVAA